MRSLMMWNKTVTLTALLAGLAIISLDALAVEATPTTSEKAAIAAEKAAPLVSQAVDWGHRRA